MTTTYVAAVAGESLLIKIGDGAGPEVFTALASINAARDLSMTTTEKTTEIPRVDTPSAPAYVDREITAVDWQLSGSGICNAGDDKTFADWLISGASKNVKLVSNSTGALTISGAAKLTEFKITGDRGGKVEFSATLKGAGLPVASASS